jgi:PAS domain S-box-containing protein
MNLLHVDVQALLLATFVLCLTIGAAVGVAARDTRSDELRVWALAVATHGASYLLLMQRGVWPDWASIVVANFLFSASLALMLLALARYWESRPAPWLLRGPPPLAALICALTLDAHETRIALLNALYAAQAVGLLHMTVRDTGRKRGRGHRLMIAGFSVAAFVFTTRAIALLAGAASIPMLTAQSPVQTFSFLLGFVALLLASLGFVFKVMERIERQATEARRLLTTIFDSAEETIAMFRRDGTLLAINRVGAERFDTTPQKMIGMRLADAMAPEIAGPRLAAIQRVADSGQGETLTDTRAGRVYRQTLYPVADDPQRVVAFATDITERLAAENALREKLEETLRLNKKLEEAHSQLLQSEKMASIGQLAAGVAHELNNPIGFVHSNLGTLRGYLTDLFLIADAGDGEKARLLKADRDYDYLKTDIFQLLDESAEGLERVKKIVLDLKDFSRPGETDWQWADLHQGLDSTLNIVWNELKYKCTVRKEYGVLPRVRCLPAQLNQVFMNLLVNAAHAIETKGEIVVATRAPDDKTVQIVVADTGKGIAPEHLKRVFDPFFTTKPVGQGTGLGLSVSWGIIQKHHGRIEVASEPGKGTTFTVTLPVEPPLENETAVPPAPTFETT